MNTSDLTPRNLPRPLAPFLDNGFGGQSIPDLSLTFTDNRFNSPPSYKKSDYFRSGPPPTNSQGILPPKIGLSINDTEKISKNPHSSPQQKAYSEDLRLKFYQKLQSRRENNFSQPRPPIASPVLNDSVLSENNHNYNQVCHRNDYSTKHQQLRKRDLNDGENDNIRQLFQLIELQNQKIESLKLQVKMLQTIQHDEFDRIKILEKDHDSKNLLDNITKRIQQESETKQCQKSDKISIGVMTSFEFTSQNTSKNHHIETPTKTIDKNDTLTLSTREMLNSAKDQLEKIIEDSENVLSECNKDKAIERTPMELVEQPVVHVNSEKNVSFEDPENVIDNNSEIMKATSGKIGWTFYNNVLCQVNEILHDSATSHESKKVIDSPQKCTTKQVKIIETTITTGLASGIATSNISDKVPVDSSFYPRVNYHASNPMHSSHSISDTNASLHMKTLALKYLGEKYQSDGQIQQKRSVEFLSNFVMDNNIPDNNLSLATRNYIAKYQLASEKNYSPYGNWNTDESNILDISILKRQPKLL